jgi:sacsin
MAEFILCQFSLLPLEVQVKLQALPMVPVTRLNGNKTSRFALAAEIIDPSVPELKGLCFDDEEIFPKKSFFRKFSVALKGCGLKSVVDEAVIEHRIRCYANTKYPFLDIQKRAQRLLKSTCGLASPPREQEDSDLRRLVWLPTADLSGTLSLKASDKCRGRRDRLLVSSQLPILTVSISAEWEERLGWNNRLPRGILLEQLSFGIQRKDREIVDAVLTYIPQHDLTEPLANALMNLPCVLASNGLFVKPSRAFRPPEGNLGGCERLQPYLANVDRKFWQDHQGLLTGLKVGDQIHPSDLLKVQKILEAKPALRESDVAVAIETLNLASKFPRKSLAGLKVISDAGRFHSIQEININDLGSLKMKQKVNLVHPGIPPRTIQRLGIGSLRERLIKGLLEIKDDDDEDEFDQRENVTTRIADTLDRYPVESTFREYLANADDVKEASRLSWLLDERAHPHENLLTPEMKLFQGPAFLVHNDGMRRLNTCTRCILRTSSSLLRVCRAKFESMIRYTTTKRFSLIDDLAILPPCPFQIYHKTERKGEAFSGPAGGRNTALEDV